ncbi:hypothetical protein [Endozoicomonas sp. 8E]|uniref:hypothetical protein n=1 Tax=Endozoicomonas sp. 8E TaxID=3035692 RepID=UPI002939250F|nr:hypothetical protein [Endozoicomonas sp. 8E]WOG29044.1 hypothetical protein P6910_05105 [Endozoicomonas sp. 8E]
MQFVLIGFLLLFHLHQTCDANRQVYQSTWWIDELYSHAENKSMSVKLNSQMYFVCPNAATVVKMRTDVRQAPTLYENIWLTDNETYYENCEIPDNPSDQTDVHFCRDPHRLGYLSILFLEHAAGKDDRTFKGGQHYYIMSTSTGYKSSLGNKKDGHCRTHNMRLKVYICKHYNETDPSCSYPDPQLNWYNATGAFLSAPIKTLLTNPLTTTVPTNAAVNGTAIINTTVNATVPVTMINNDTAIVVTTATGTAPVTMANNETAIVLATTSGTAPVTMTDNDTTIVMTTTSGTTHVTMADNETAIVVTTAFATAPVTMADNNTAIVMTTASASAPVTMADNNTAIAMTTTSATAPVTMTDNSTAIVMTTTSATAPVTMADNVTAIVMTTASGTAPVNTTDKSTAIVMTTASGTAPVTMADNVTAIVMTTASGTAPVNTTDKSTAIVMTTASGTAHVTMADNETAIVMTTASGTAPVTMADNETAIVMTTASGTAPVTTTDRSIAIVMTTAYGTAPVTGTDKSTAIVMTTASGTASVTRTVNNTQTDTETTPTRYEHSLAQPVRLVWMMGDNQTRTANIFEEEHYPVIAQCKVPNTRINLLNDKGTIINSWLCQKVGERLTILKPKYRYGDVYLFEASPEYRRIRAPKSKLSVNVVSSRDYHTNNADTFYNPQVLPLLISVYLISASAL